MVRLLVLEGANCNAQDNEGNTALHYAKDKADIAQLLLTHGARDDIANNNGRTPIDLATGDARALLALW
jgi:ankyrin repeat protein